MITLRTIGLVREVAIVVFSIAQDSVGAANCYFLASQASMLFAGGGRGGKVIGLLLLAVYSVLDPSHALFAVVVFVPFLLWPNVSKAAYDRRGIAGIFFLSVLFNTLMLFEMASGKIPIVGRFLPSPFGFPIFSLYLTVLGGYLAFRLSRDVPKLGMRDFGLLTGICAVRMSGPAWDSWANAWLILTILRVAEILIPQWIALKRIGLGTK